MNRPAYETEQDRQAEYALLRRLFGDRVCHKLPIRYHLDYMVEQPGKPAWVECKQRRVPWGTYPSYLLSLEKYLSGVKLARASGGSFILLTGWSDGKVMYANLNCGLPCVYKLSMGGRTDRGDAQDREPVILIPNNHFGAAP